MYSSCIQVIVLLCGLHIGGKMKQKTVMKVQMNCEKCRVQALKLAVSADGVIFAGIEGPGKDKVVVIGDGVDAVELVTFFRKKFGYAALVSVAEVK